MLVHYLFPSVVFVIINNKYNFKSLKKKSAPRHVYEKIKEGIVSGVYHEGKQLPSEIELCNTFKVSRIVIREALKELEGAGLIETAKGGRFVKNIDADIITNGLDIIIKSKKATYKQMLEARKIIECATAQMAAANRTDDMLEKMLTVVDLNTKSRAEFIHRNYKLHEYVALASQNMILFYLLQALRTLIVQSYDMVPFENIPIEKVNGMHWEIYQAIKDRDPERAGKAVINDLDSFSGFFSDHAE